MKINSVIFHTENISPIRNFYESQLGLTVGTFEQDGVIRPDCSEAYVNYDVDGLLLCFEKADGRTDRGTIVLNTLSFESLKDRFVESKIDFSGDGIRWLKIKDPDGRSLIFEPLVEQKMSRQPVQVLVIPFREVNSSLQFCVLKRSDSNDWQFIAGGAEKNETVFEAAKREASEEAGIPESSKMITLDSVCSMPANVFRDWKEWPEGTFIVKEYSFGVWVESDLKLSLEHSEYKWCDYDEAHKLLKWDSNKTALWELAQRFKISALR